MATKFDTFSTCSDVTIPIWNMTCTYVHTHTHTRCMYCIHMHTHNSVTEKYALENQQAGWYQPWLPWWLLLPHHKQSVENPQL